MQLSCVIVDADASNRQELSSFLASNGVTRIIPLQNLDLLPGTLGQGDPPRLAVVNLDPDPPATLARISPLIRQYPAISFFVMSKVLETSLVLDSMHAGVKEFVPLPVDQAKFRAAIERIAQMQGDTKRAKVIQFIPTIGGCGSTTIACNVAAALAKSHKTLLIDLDLVRGAAANAFDVRARYSIADVMDPTTELDAALLDNALAVHRASGLSILSRPEMPEDAQRVTKVGVSRLLGVVGRMFDYVLLDSVMSTESLYSQLLQSSDLNVLVLQLNVPSAKNTERFLGTVRRMGIDVDKIKVIVNRSAKKGYDIEPDEVEKAMGLKISWMVPNDFKNAIQAINYGEPVVLRAPRADVSESLYGLTQMLNGRSAAAVARK